MHARQRPLPSDIGEVWLAALEDAEIDSDNALLFPFRAVSATDGNCACYWRRGMSIDPEDVPVELNWAFVDLNQPDSIKSYRVAIGTDRSIQGIAALLRHELEHARQFDAHGAQLRHLYDAALDILNIRAAGLPGGGVFYQWIPMEFDANAAAAMFVRARFSDETINQLLLAEDPDRAAFLAIASPGPIETLPERMLFFLASMSNLCDRWSEQTGWDFPGRLDSSWRGARDAWTQLRELRLPRR